MFKNINCFLETKGRNLKDDLLKDQLYGFDNIDGLDIITRRHVLDVIIMMTDLPYTNLF